MSSSSRAYFNILQYLEYTWLEWPSKTYILRVMLHIKKSLTPVLSLNAWKKTYNLYLSNLSVTRKQEYWDPTVITKKL